MQCSAMGCVILRWMPVQMKAVWDATGALWAKGSLVGKPAAAFTSVGTQVGARAGVCCHGSRQGPAVQWGQAQLPAAAPRWSSGSACTLLRWSGIGTGAAPAARAGHREPCCKCREEASKPPL